MKMRISKVKEIWMLTVLEVENIPGSQKMLKMKKIMNK